MFWLSLDFEKPNQVLILTIFLLLGFGYRSCLFLYFSATHSLHTPMKWLKVLLYSRSYSRYLLLPNYSGCWGNQCTRSSSQSHLLLLYCMDTGSYWCIPQQEQTEMDSYYFEGSNINLLLVILLPPLSYQHRNKMIIIARPAHHTTNTSSKQEPTHDAPLYSESSAMLSELLVSASDSTVLATYELNM